VRYIPTLERVEDGLLTEWGVFHPAFEVPKPGALTEGKAKGGGGGGGRGQSFFCCLCIAKMLD